MANQSSRFFCFGLGYVGLRLAERLQSDGWKVAGTTRTEESYHELELKDIEPYFFRFGRLVEQPDMMLAGTTHILITVPPSPEVAPVLKECALAIEYLPNLKWLGYLSTTGVYGDHAGGWVDETTPVNPPDERSKRRVESENQWLDLFESMKVPVHIFRLAGIYGPNRNILQQIKATTARWIEKEGQVFSRIHVDDIVTILHASMNNPTPGEIFNVCDDHPSPAHKVLEYGCELLGVEPPSVEKYDEAQMSEMMQSFYRASRRVKNDKVKQQLGIELAYPSYKEGLKALIDSVK